MEENGPLPTIVVGLGGAGAGIVKHTRDVIQKESRRVDNNKNYDLEDFFKFYLIDSNDDKFDWVGEDVPGNVIEDEKTCSRRINRGTHTYMRTLSTAVKELVDLVPGPGSN
jgi:hypothetical protein